MEKVENRISINGRLTLEIIRAGGVTEKHVSKNLVGDWGTTELAIMLSGGTPGDQVQYMALGSDATAPTVSDVALGVELYRRQATVTQTASQVEYQSTWSAGGAAGTIREAGLFNAATGGNLFSRTVFADLVIGPSDTLIATWDITFVGV